MEFRDVEGEAPKVGDPLRMRFRVKSIDRKRGFAAPFDRPLLESPCIDLM
jgi:hypothetical protein